MENELMDAQQIIMLLWPWHKNVRIVFKLPNSGYWLHLPHFAIPPLPLLTPSIDPLQKVRAIAIPVSGVSAKHLLRSFQH